MRYLVGFAFVLALVALPVSASAQDAEEGETSEPNVVEAVPSSEPAPEEPDLQLQLNETGVEVTPRPPRTFLGYTLEELELRKRRAALGLIAPAALIIAGVPPLVVGTSGDRCADVQVFDTDYCRRLRTAGMVFTISGTVGMIIGLALLGARGRALRLAEKDYTHEGPALQLQLDDAGVDVAPSPPRTPDGYSLEEADLRVKRVRIALLSSTGVFFVGTALALAAYSRIFPTTEPTYSPDPMMLAGLSLLGAGTLGMLVSGGMLSSRARDLRQVRPLDFRASRARRALLSWTGVLLLSGMVMALAPTASGYGSAAVLWAGVGLATAASLGMLISGAVLGVRKRQLRELRQAHYGTPRRIHWDLARSRLVF